uniref:Uncharacterized protein n=1 Tax=Poecilia reticulata TaxID=8081 RepID=A0A3P9NRW0_POERE
MQEGVCFMHVKCVMKSECVCSMCSEVQHTERGVALKSARTRDLPLSDKQTVMIRGSMCLFSSFCVILFPVGPVSASFPVDCLPGVSRSRDCPVSPAPFAPCPQVPFWSIFFFFLVLLFSKPSSDT